MRKLLMGVLATLFIPICALAQKPASGELIKKGIALHDESKYAEAIKLYRQVSRNDSNYHLALYEIAYSQMADSNFQDALKTCEQALAIENNEYALQVFVIKGNTLDDMGDPDGALAAYDSALRRYPNSEGLLFNKAITLHRKKQTTRSMALLQQLLVRNPYYASAHYRLAQWALEQGKLVPALMGAFTYMLLQPEGQYNNNCIQLMAQITKGSEEAIKYASKRDEDQYAPYATVEKIILSGIALDKNYKAKIKLDDPLLRQLQVMMEKLRYEEDSEDFWMQYYVPILKLVYDRGQFEPTVFYAFSALKLDPIQQYIKRNGKEIKEMSAMITGQLNAIRATRELHAVKRQKAEELYHFEEGVFVGKGKSIGDKLVGPWTIYHSNGNPKSVGLFDDEGKRTGTWKFYNIHGGLGGTEEWKAGVQWGEDITYNSKGVLIRKTYFKNDKEEGERQEYYSIGPLSSTQEYKNGKAEGRYRSFYASGGKKAEGTQRAEELDGAFISYHENGETDTKCTYANGKLNGLYQSYHDNGQLSFTGTYANGELEGETTTYYRNGKIKRKASYRKSLLEGDELEYASTGELTSKVSYKAGKAEGPADYLHEGKRFSRILFENNKLKQVQYWNKEGKEISSFSRPSKQFVLTTYSPLGYKASQSTFDEKDQLQGEQVYFFPSGKPKDLFPYRNGELEGQGVTYFSNGKKHYVSHYSGGKRNGIYQSYFLNGQLQNEGYYIDGDLNGDWTEYNEKGIVTSTSTYLNDNLIGKKSIHFANGKLDCEEEFYGGWLYGVKQYDTTGKVIAEVRFPNGNGTFRGVYFNGKPRFEYTYKNGSLEGPNILYYIDGTIQLKKQYRFGELHGPYLEFHTNGKPSVEGAYTWGRRTGTWKHYRSDGSLHRDETYVDGELHGKRTDYENGKIERVTEFREGSRHGSMTRYAEDGQLMNVFYYLADELVGYSYSDKNKQLLPTIPLVGGTGKVVTYYSNGNKSAEIDYLDGLLNGVFRLYYPNGKVQYESNEICNLTHGRLSEFYPNGQVKTDLRFFFDNQDGPYRYFHENGNVKEQGESFNGYYHGWRIFFDLAGKETDRHYYYYGNLLKKGK
jgi:antitoxin component YwqK of YwqJK toxin-antitoxin module/Tfp pilus assembly protein PilF